MFKLEGGMIKHQMVSTSVEEERNQTELEQPVAAYGQGGFDRIIVASLELLSHAFPSLKPMKVSLLTSEKTKLITTVGNIRTLLFQQMAADYKKENIPFVPEEHLFVIDQVLQSFYDTQDEIDLDRAVIECRREDLVIETQFYSALLIELARKKIQLNEISLDNQEAAFYISNQGTCIFCAKEDSRAKLLAIFIKDNQGKEKLDVNVIGDLKTLNYFEVRFLHSIKVILNISSRRNLYSIEKQLLLASDMLIENEYHNFIERKMPEQIESDTEVVVEGMGTGVNRIEVYGQGYLASGLFSQAEAPLFWHMIMQEKPSVIVKLTDMQPKSWNRLYWPNGENVVWTFGEEEGSLRVKCTKIEWIPEDCIYQRTFVVTQGTSIHKVIQLDFQNWPDCGIPKKENLQKLILRTNEIKDSSGPIYVHCTAGIGRTGTFIAAHSSLKIAMQRKKPNYLKSIFKMRSQRPYRMVETSKQYLFLHRLYEPDLPLC